eukprot:s7_g27.t1
MPLTPRQSTFQATIYAIYARERERLRILAELRAEELGAAEALHLSFELRAKIFGTAVVIPVWTCDIDLDTSDARSPHGYARAFGCLGDDPSRCEACGMPMPQKSVAIWNARSSKASFDTFTRNLVALEIFHKKPSSAVRKNCMSMRRVASCVRRCLEDDSSTYGQRRRCVVLAESFALCQEDLLELSQAKAQAATSEGDAPKMSSSVRTFAVLQEI